MAYRPILTVDVEHEDAIFTFKSPDAAMSKLMAITQRCLADGMSEADVDLRPPADLLEALSDIFVEGVIGWTGVEGESKPIECNGGTKRVIPFADKVVIAQGYIANYAELEAGKVASAEADLSITPPEAPVDDSKKTTDGPAKEKQPKAEAEE